MLVSVLQLPAITWAEVSVAQCNIPLNIYFELGVVSVTEISWVKVVVDCWLVTRNSVAVTRFYMGRTIYFAQSNIQWNIFFEFGVVSVAEISWVQVVVYFRFFFRKFLCVPCGM